MNQMEIGKFIAELRKEKNMTQQELANKLNITDRAISHWENGRSMPDAGIMLELCKALDINVNELLSAKKIGECLQFFVSGIDKLSSARLTRPCLLLLWLFSRLLWQLFWPRFPRRLS